MTTETAIAFDQLGLSEPIQKALDAVGYETPSPIQAETIPLMLEGRDVLGQAQTGTGKTAAFALPILSQLDLAEKLPQVLVLAPTRELAIQVAEAFQTYASGLKGFYVSSLCGGQDFRRQLQVLNRGVHVLVGTPGRVMDHIRRGTLVLDKLTTLVLDEADEMLRMGFIDDVEWILDQTPDTRQIALFSATMPTQIRRIATRYLNDPVHVTIKAKTATADTIRQRYWPVKGVHKLDALTRILEIEEFDAMIIFVRTKTSTSELAEKLQARGYAAVALNGDMQQSLRERTIDQLKKGKLDILVATDVASRGLDVQRISHVLNYDIPYDIETYIHRIGRTGRAGRNGDAILFVAPRERRMLKSIERATNKEIDVMELPSSQLINDHRVTKFKKRIADTIANEDLSFFTKMIEDYQQESESSPTQIGAALAHLFQGDTPFLLQSRPVRVKEHDHHRDDNKRQRPSGDRSERSDRKRRPSAPREGMERYRLAVGRNHGVKPGNIVGAIANEAGIDSQDIGSISIQGDYSLVDLPKGMPKTVFDHLKQVWVTGQKLNIVRASKEDEKGADSGRARKPRDNARGGKPNHRKDR